MQFLTLVVAALTTGMAFGATLQKRVDNRIPVNIPDGLTLDSLCAEWNSACVATVAAKEPGATATIFCAQAPPQLYPNAANVFCTTSPTTLYTDDVIAELGLTRA